MRNSTITYQPHLLFLLITGVFSFFVFNLQIENQGFYHQNKTVGLSTKTEWVLVKKDMSTPTKELWDYSELFSALNPGSCEQFTTNEHDFYSIRTFASKTQVNFHRWQKKELNILFRFQHRFLKPNQDSPDYIC